MPIRTRDKGRKRARESFDEVEQLDLLLGQEAGYTDSVRRCLNTRPTTTLAYDTNSNNSDTKP